MKLQARAWRVFMMALVVCDRAAVGEPEASRAADSVGKGTTRKMNSKTSLATGCESWT